MRISVSVTTTNVPLPTDLIPMDVFPEMTINDIGAIVEDELKLPGLSQTFFYNNNPIIDNSKTLTELNITEGDMLGLAIQNRDEAMRRRRPQLEDSSPQRQQRQRSGPDPETLRLQLLGDARHLQQIQAQDPELADATVDRDRFRAVLDDRRRKLARAQMEKEEQIELLNADPFNIEAQTKIEEMIRQERVQENVQKALEENPESFGRVHMLYIDVLVNNTPIKAFVDSGAQTTIMSPDAAKRCGIMRLIDTRFGGIARGVGTAKILGKVHSADIQIGQFSLASSFTVMEGKDVDLLLGLDMLKRHQMCIDLGQDALIIQGDKIPFLPENQLPKMMDEILNNEPKIPGPEGTTIGATTGTVQKVDPPSDSSKVPTESSSTNPSSSRINIHPAGSSGNVYTAPEQSNTLPSRPHNQQSAFGEPQPITPESIAKITDLGFSREEAIDALEQTEGNVELAVGILL